MDERELKAEKKRLQNILKEMSQKSESERKLELVDLLHQYNDVKDAVQTLISALANIENVTFKEIHERLELNSED